MIDSLLILDSLSPVPPILMRPKKTMMAMVAEVAEKYEVTPEDLKGPSRRSEFIAARQEAMWRARNELGKSLPYIGRYFGDRDHTTVIHACRRHAQRQAEARA